MEAKDTIMTYEQTEVIVGELSGLEASPEKVDLLRTELEAQAEISFRAGVEQEREKIEAIVKDILEVGSKQENVNWVRTWFVVKELLIKLREVLKGK